MGFLIMKIRLRTALEIRLRANEWFRLHPEILEQEVAPIWLITGLQRTGTTFLQRLLSEDPNVRPLLSWESLNPVPVGDRKETARRIRMAKQSEKALAWMSPSFFAIHPIDHLAPEEDVLLLDHAFMTTAPEATMQVPSYAAWLEQQDHRQAYAWEKKMLLLLQWQHPASRWILKSPHHLEFLDAFTDTFPNSKIIWTHREPEFCIPSFLSMVYHGRRMFSNKVRLDEVTAHWIRKTRHMLDKGIQFRNSNRNIIEDVDFDLLVQDAEIVLASIYGAFDEAMDQDQKQHMFDAVAESNRYKFGKHSYHLSDFGLDTDSIRSDYSNYYSLLNQLRRHDKR